MYRFFLCYVRKFEAGTQSALGLDFTGFVQCWQTTCLQSRAENVTRKKVFLIFLFQKNTYCLCQRRFALESFKSPVLPVLMCRVIHFQLYALNFLGDLKESPSLGEPSHVMFSRMAKYYSLTAFYTFSEQHPKSYRGQSLFPSVLKFMYRAVKSTKVCSVPRIFKTKCKLFMCAKGKHKTKNNSPCWPQRTLQNKAAETIFWILESKNVSIASIGNSVFDEIDNVKS